MADMEKCASFENAKLETGQLDCWVLVGCGGLGKWLDESEVVFWLQATQLRDAP